MSCIALNLLIITEFLPLFFSLSRLKFSMWPIAGRLSLN